MLERSHQEFSARVSDSKKAFDSVEHRNNCFLNSFLMLSDWRERHVETAWTPRGFSREKRCFEWSVLWLVKRHNELRGQLTGVFISWIWNCRKTLSFNKVVVKQDEEEAVDVAELQNSFYLVDLQKTFDSVDVCRHLIIGSACFRIDLNWPSM